MDFNQMPPTPQRPFVQQSYTSDGMAIPTEVYPPQQRSSLGANFSGLIGNGVMVPTSPVQAMIPVDTKKKKKKKVDKETGIITVDPNESDVPEVVSSKAIVESTVYGDTYAETTGITYGVIAQADELLRDCKQELDFIRSQRNMKGKYHYLNATVTSMSSLLSTKLAAIKEINSNIKNINDMEYRRYKDTRMLDATDDNKAIMDAYSAFISAPVGAPQYKLPTTVDITGGLDGIIRADYPADVQKNMDAGMAQYLGNLTPEENLMLIDNNKDIEEVIIYDESTGAKRFQWINSKTGEFLTNLPPSSDLTISDFTVDLKTRTARNTNLNMIKKVIVKNDSAFSKF